MLASHKQMQRWALTAVVAAGSAWVAQTATMVLVSNWRAAPAVTSLKDWSTGRTDWTAMQWEEAHAELQEAGRINPTDPALQESIASLYALRGKAEWGDGLADSPGVVQYRQAVKYQRQAVALRPRYPYAWANLAFFHYAANDTNDKIFGAWSKALELGPHESELRAALLNVAHMSWAVAPPEVSDWVERESPGATARWDKELADAEAAYSAAQAKAREQVNAAATAAALAAQAERDRLAMAQRAEDNARKPAFQSLIGTPGQVSLPR